jgi:peptide/nickel transport system permease protein
VGGTRAKTWKVFGASALVTIVVLEVLVKINWFLQPGLGPILYLLISVGIAFGVTHLSMGISNRVALKSSLTVAGIAFVLYFPMQKVFELQKQGLLLVASAVVTILIAIGVGLYFAKIDRASIIRTTVLTAILLGILMIVDQLMGTWERYMGNDAINYRPVPTVGQSNPILEQGDYWISTLDLLMHLVLPTIALTAISFAGYIRFSRGTMLEVLNQDYIRTARAKGLTERTVIMRHAFRNTMIPMTTIIVVDFASIIGGAIITERVFGWTGMGTLFNKAVGSFDLNLLMGVFFLTGTLALVANLVADLLYSALDPRIRVGSGK